MRLFVVLMVLAPSLALGVYDPCRNTRAKLGEWLTPWRDHSQSPIREVRNVEYSVSLDRRIRNYQELTGRTATEQEVRRARKATAVLQSLKFDRVHATVKILEPLFEEVHEAYHINHHNQSLVAELKKLRHWLNGEMGHVDGFEKWVRYNKVEEPYVETAIQSKDVQEVTRAIDRLIEAFEAHSLKLRNIMAYHFDEYEAARSMLEVCTKGKDALADRAKEALERLESSKILPNLFTKVPLRKSNQATPHYRDIKHVITYDSESSDNRRWWKGNAELLAALLALSPTDALFHQLDRLAATIPWVNHPKFRAVLQFLQSERSIIIYYPDLQRVIEGYPDAKQKLTMLELLNSPTNDVLVITFARRLDVREMWEAVKTEAKKREDKSFYNKMLEAQKAREILGDLVLWHHPQVSLGMRTFMDFVIYSAVAALGYYQTPLGRWLGRDDGDEDDEKKEKLSDEAKSQMKEIQQDVDSVFNMLREDPEGMNTLDELKSRSRGVSF